MEYHGNTNNFSKVELVVIRNSIRFHKSIDESNDVVKSSKFLVALLITIALVLPHLITLILTFLFLCENRFYSFLGENRFYSFLGENRFYSFLGENRFAIPIQLKEEVQTLTANLRKHNFTFGDEKVEYISDSHRGFKPIPKTCYQPLLSEAVSTNYVLAQY